LRDQRTDTRADQPTQQRPTEGENRPPVGQPDEGQMRRRHTQTARLTSSMPNAAIVRRGTERDESRYWCAVACREHVKLGLKGGFAQVCNGRKQPLARMKPHDGIVYYSPADRREEGRKCQKFTSIGLVKDNHIYPVEMTAGFVPFRRDILYFDAVDVPIGPLLPHLSFTKEWRNWGYRFRFGLFAIDQDDFVLILSRMNPALCIERHGSRNRSRALAGMQTVFPDLEANS